MDSKSLIAQITESRYSSKEPLFFENAIMTVDECAEFLRLSTCTVLSMVRASEIPHSRISPKKILFIREDILDWLRRKEFPNGKKAGRG